MTTDAALRLLLAEGICEQFRDDIAAAADLDQLHAARDLWADRLTAAGVTVAGDTRTAETP